ncbi:MAG: hypothetical protein QM756_20700 [Polyangiaceae bacterium]
MAERAPESHTQPRAAEPTPIAPWFQRASSLAHAHDQPFVSAHFTSGRAAEIRVNAESLQAYLDVVRDSHFDDGTLITEWLRPDNRTPGSVLALELRGGSWHYWQVDLQGHGAELGDASPCQGCHAGALAAPVFGLARPGAESKPLAPR